MRVGLIGLGAMGEHMARNLHKAGLLAGVWNRTPGKALSLGTELHCNVAASPAALAEEVDAIVLCVSADGDVLAVVTQLAAAVRAGTLVMDCSTVSAETARQAT